MPDLLIELLSEEIPARMQQRAAQDLRTLVTDGLVDAGLVYESAMAFAGPRRLVLTVAGLPDASPETAQERKGPRIDAPEKALTGFARSAGLANLQNCEIRQDKKGDFYVATITKPGQPAPVIIASVIEAAVRRFPWPKSMRWGAGTLRWVRPLHAIVAILSTKDGEAQVVPLEIDGIIAGDMTRGHATMVPRPIKVTRFEDYAASLFVAKVEIDGARRRQIILADARELAFAQGLELVEDEALANEVAGLVEWPVVLMGRL
ncbi:MAG: glycine--tRNA ligase subunit beta, partial [Alphaproteobacteria bacterium]